VRFGGIRKPRIANASMLAQIKAKGWVLPGSININFTIPEASAWCDRPFVWFNYVLFCRRFSFLFFTVLFP
jgi:hypothetical protein